MASARNKTARGVRLTRVMRYAIQRRAVPHYSVQCHAIACSASLQRAVRTVKGIVTTVTYLQRLYLL